ncbi:MAG: alpha/beta hydrolase [Candidatus Sericytochromatia bacterium]
MNLEQYGMADGQTPDSRPDQASHFAGSLLAWVLLVCLGWGGLLLSGPLPYQRQVLQWREGSATLRGELWLPGTKINSSGLSGPSVKGPRLPGVILVHGVMASRDQPELAARVLSRAGMAVLSFDLRGYGESDAAPDTPEVHRQDVLSALAFLRAQPGIDPHRIALLGHSMGASAVSEAAAEDGHVRLALAMGMHGEGPVEWLTGLYDALHPPGAFRAVTVSPAADHHVEWQDAWMLNRVQRRLETAFGLEQGPPAWPECLRSWSLFLLGLGMTGLLSRLLAQAHGYLRLACATVPVLALLAAGGFDWLEPAACAGAMLIVLLAYVVSQLPPRLLRTALLLVAGLYLARTGASLLRALPWILPDPGRLLWFPLYLWQSLLYYPTSLLNLLRGLLFAHSHSRLEAAWPLGLIALAEWLFPAWWLKIGAKLKLPHQRQRMTLVTLGLGLVALAALLWIRLQQGYLAGDALQQTGAVLATDLLPSLGLFGLGIWIWKKRPRDDSNIRPTV